MLFSAIAEDVKKMVRDIIRQDGPDDMNSRSLRRRCAVGPHLS
jgi:hypothetical protein